MTSRSVTPRRKVLELLAGGFAAATLSSPSSAATNSGTSRKLLCVDLRRALIHAVDGPSVPLVSRVIVGMPATPTPPTASRLTHVRFRPSWRPTKTIREIGGYPDAIWPPGLDNPLGLATVHFEGGGLIYLHGTNQPELFDEADRALSYGCVRVERLEALVSWILDWPVERTRAAMLGERSFHVSAPAIPLLIAGEDQEPLLSMLARLAEGRVLETS